MREVTMSLVPYVPEDETFTVVDWKTDPAEMLEEVSQLLKPYGLCIVLADSQDDSYRFKVEKRGDDRLMLLPVGWRVTDEARSFNGRHVVSMRGDGPMMGVTGVGDTREKAWSNAIAVIKDSFPA